jgi:hypothetical protein
MKYTLAVYYINIHDSYKEKNNMLSIHIECVFIFFYK